MPTGDEFSPAPAMSVDGKFVMIRSPEETALVMGGLREFPYHAALVDRYCSLRQIPSGWVHRPDLYEIFDPDYLIRGGGLVLLDASARKADFSGFSTAYGRFAEAELEEVVAGESLFRGWEVSIG